MDWKNRLAKNPDRNGDPVTALWRPSGYLVATSFPLASHAIAWIVRLAFGDDAGRVIERIDDPMVETVDGLRSLARILGKLEATRMAKDGRYAPNVPKPLIAGLRIQMQSDALVLHAFRDAPFSSRVTLTVRPHDAKRDGSEQGPPVIGIEWGTTGRQRDVDLRMPETFAAVIRNCSVAWPDTVRSGLTSVTFSVASNVPLKMPNRWELVEIRWPSNRGGIVCFGGQDEVRYVVTLPRELASPLIHRIGDGTITIFGGEHYYLGERPRSRLFQKF